MPASSPGVTAGSGAFLSWWHWRAWAEGSPQWACRPGGRSPRGCVAGRPGGCTCPCHGPSGLGCLPKTSWALQLPGGCGWGSSRMFRTGPVRSVSSEPAQRSGPGGPSGGSHCRAWSFVMHWGPVQSWRPLFRAAPRPHTLGSSAGRPPCARRPCPAQRGASSWNAAPSLWSQTCPVLPPPEGTLPRAGCSCTPGPVA